MQVKATRMYRVKAVAEMYDVSVSTIYRAIEAGQLDALRIGTGKGAIRIPDYALSAWEESCVLEASEVDSAAIAADQAEEVA
jgi:excisionase family DNA binding protein